MIIDRIIPRILATVILMDKPNVMHNMPRSKRIGEDSPKDCP